MKLARIVCCGGRGGAGEGQEAAERESETHGPASELAGPVSTASVRVKPPGLGVCRA